MSSPSFMSKRVQAIVTLVAVVSTGAALTSLVYGRRLSRPEPSGMDSYGEMELDHEAFAETMRKLGIHVDRHRLPTYDLGAPLVLIEPTFVANVEGQVLTLREALGDRFDDRLPTLIVLPKWFRTTDGEETVAEALAPSDMDVITETLSPELFVHDRGSLGSDFARERLTGTLGTFEVELPWLQTMTVPFDFEVLLSRGHDPVIARSGDLVVVSDPDIFHNYNLHRADHALIAYRLVYDVLQTDTILLDEVFHGHGHQPSLAAAMGEFPLVFFTIQGALLMLLLVVAGSARFGPRARFAMSYARGPKAMIEVSAAVLSTGQGSSRQGSARLATNYLEFVLRDLAQRALGQSVHHGIPQAGPLDALARRRGVLPKAQELVRESQALEAQGKASLRDSLAVARKAYLFRKAVLAACRVSGPAPLTKHETTDLAENASAAE